MRELEDTDSFPSIPENGSISEPESIDDRIVSETAPYYQSFVKQFYAPDASLAVKEQSTLELFNALIKIQEVARQEDKYYRNELLGKLAAVQIAPLLAKAEGMTPEKFARFTYENQETIKGIMGDDDLLRAASLILMQDRPLMAKVEKAFRETYPMVIAEREFTNQLRRWRSIFSSPPANTPPATDRFIKNLSQAMETLPDSLMNNVQDPSSEAADLVSSWIQSELLILQAHELPPKTGQLHQRKEELSKDPIIGWFFQKGKSSDFPQKSHYQKIRESAFSEVESPFPEEMIFKKVRAEHPNLEAYERSVRLQTLPNIAERNARILKAAAELEPYFWRQTDQRLSFETNLLEPSPLPEKERLFHNAVKTAAYHLAIAGISNGDAFMQKVRAAQFFGLEAGYSPEELVGLSESAFSALRELHGNRLDIYRSVYFNAPNKIKPELEKLFPSETLQRIKAPGGAGFTTDIGNLAGLYMHPSNHFMAQNFP